MEVRDTEQSENGENKNEEWESKDEVSQKANKFIKQ